MLPTNRSAIAFARGARTESCHLDPGTGENGVKHGVSVADEESGRRAGGDPEDVDLAGGVFDDEERIEPVR
jgi:hypothetical protein